jgi:hypothetical protein
MSLTGKPPQDLSLSNLVVKDTLVATQATALNVDAVTINKIPTATTLQPIRSVFPPFAEIGQWVVGGGIERFYFLGLINQSGEDQPADTVLAQVDNYCDGPFRLFNGHCQSPDGRGGLTFPAFLYCPEAANIETAGLVLNLTINTVGEVSLDGKASNRDVVKSTSSKPELQTQVN